MNKTLALFIVAFLSINFLLKAQNIDDPSRWTPEDIINTEYMRSASISPNNTMVSIWSVAKF